VSFVPTAKDPQVVDGDGLQTWEIRIKLKVTVFCVVVPCRLIEIERCFRGVYYYYNQGNHPDDGGSKHL
jgi:hypothetical protein